MSRLGSSLWQARLGSIWGAASLGMAVRRFLVEQIEIAPTGLHRMNDLFDPVVVTQNNRFQYSGSSIEPQDENSLWMVVIQWPCQDCVI